MDWIKGTEEQGRDNVIDHLLGNKIIRYEIADFFLGKFLGNGISRYVFESKFDPRLVLKIEIGEQAQNAMEWEVWRHISYVHKLNMWFAPCHHISECNRILCQSKCKPLTSNLAPKKVPIFFSDIKLDNWGIYKGNPVCTDYGNILLMENGMSSKMKKVMW